MMEAPRTKPITYDIKKEKRFQAKKRKLEALLNLFQAEEQNEVTEKKNRSGGTQKQDYKALKDELKHFMKKPDIEPLFYLTENGFKSRIRLNSKKVNKKVQPLFIENVYQLLLKSVIGHMSPHTFHWAKLEQPQNISRTILLVIEGLPKCVIVQNHSSLPNLIEIFNFIVEIASQNLPFPQELTTLHQVTHFHIENKNSYSTMFPSKKVIKLDNETRLEKPSKLHLLLSPIQLVMENYPLPQSVFQFSKCENYTYTKDSYAPVTANSPMFAVDCEMCRTDKNNNELTRIAVVNEKLKVLYQTLVKPKAKIVDYMTKYSGITKSMLQGVKITLKDVQMELRNILPPDAILCGQSLNCDLHALKMIHPYCIDTSIIFNGSGIRAKKDSLKYLTMVHLNETIQNSKHGHNPIEDALATMKLVQLKLDNSIEFGDACLSNNFSEVEKDSNKVNVDPDKIKIESEISNGTVVKMNDSNEVDIQQESGKTEDSNEVDALKESREAEESNVDTKKESMETEDSNKVVTKNESEDAETSNEKIICENKDYGFFALTSKYNKKICLIGSEETLNIYDEEIPDTVQKIIKCNAKKVIKATINNKENFDLTIAHIDFDSIEESDLVSELDRIVKLIYDTCSNRTMLMVLTSDVVKSNFEDIRSGMFMAKVKC